MSDSVRPHRQQPTRLPCPWDSPGKNTGVGCHFLLQCMKVKSETQVTQSCLTLGDPTDCSLPGSSAHGIFQARVLEWGAIAFSPKFYKSSFNIATQEAHHTCTVVSTVLWKESNKAGFNFPLISMSCLALDKLFTLRKLFPYLLSILTNKQNNVNV